MKISIVISLRHVRSLLLDLLKAIQRRIGFVPYRVILAVNSSSTVNTNVPFQGRINSTTL